MSRLADEQPYLSPQENLENQALFLRFSSAIAEVLGQTVQAALCESCPVWFSEFVRVAHRRRANLITFNYDPLIECAVGTGLLYDWDLREPVFWGEVTGGVPSWPPGPAHLGADQADTFRLLKLHGSLNWYWTPGDSAGVSIALRDLPGEFGAPRPYTEEQRRRELPGRVPFVVPPSAVKSSYYRNPVIREIWQQAAKALREAKRIFVVGYSLPQSDLTFASMLSESLKESAALLTVVDLRSAAVMERLLSLGFPDSRIHLFDADPERPVPAFATRWRDEAGADVMLQLRERGTNTLDDPLLIVWGEQTIAQVLETRPSGDSVTLVAGALSSSREAAIVAQGGVAPSTLPTLRQVLQLVGPNGCMEVLTADNRKQTIISWTIARVSMGYGRGIWNALTPSGAP